MSLPANKKLALEKSQLRSILSDFRKVKHKCIALAAELGEQIDKKPAYDALEQETSFKIELLGVQELVQHKGLLLNSLSELFDLQNDLNTRKERLQARKTFKNLTGPITLAEMGSPKAKVNSSMRQILRKPLGGQEASGRVKSKQGSFNVPVYRMTDDTSENKVDRISKYVASLKRSMKQNCIDTSHKRMKDLLLEEGEYLKIKEELERFKMREEELNAIIEKKVQAALQEKLKSAELIEETKQYRIIKVRKDAYQIERSTDECSQSSHSKNPQVAPVVMEQSEEVGDEEIREIEEQLEKEERGVKDVMEKISQTMGSSEVKLKELRDQRKKIFLDEDVWKELDEI